MVGGGGGGGGRKKKVGWAVTNQLVCQVRDERRWEELPRLLLHVLPDDVGRLAGRHSDTVQVGPLFNIVYSK